MDHDCQITALFKKRGWMVVRIWECELKKKNRIKTTPTYYLQGGFNINRLTGVYSVLMRNMLKSLQMQKNKSKEDIAFQKTIARGFDNVNVKNLQLVLYEINQAKSNEEQ